MGKKLSVERPTEIAGHSLQQLIETLKAMKEDREGDPKQIQELLDNYFREGEQVGRQLKAEYGAPQHGDRTLPGDASELAS